MVCKKTVILTGAEQKVEFKGRHCDVRNDGAGVVYVSCTPGVEPDADGVLSIPPGQAVKYCGCRGVLYLLGEGKVLICGNDYSTQVFRGATTSAGSGEGGVSQTYVDMQDADTLNKAKEYAEGLVVNGSLLDNGDFSINQRGQTEYTGAATLNGYTVDRWKQFPSYCSVTTEGSGVWLANNITADEAYSDLQQVLSEPLVIGKPYTISIELDGEALHLTMTAAEGFQRWTISADVSVYLSATSFIIRNFKKEGSCFIGWVKLEPGQVATPFAKPKEALELANCQSYYIPAPLVGLPSSVNGNSLFFFIALPVEMRVTPSLQNAVLAVIHKKTNTPLDMSEFSPFVYSHYKNGALIGLSKPGHGLDVNDYVLMLTDGGLSAEL